MKALLKITLPCSLFVSLSAAAVTPLTGDATRGKTLTAVCSACHNADGNSALPSFPKLAGLGEKYLLKQLHDIKSGNRAVVEMTGLLTEMSEQDLADIAAYFAGQSMQLSGAKAMTVRLNNGSEVDSLALGQKLYMGGNARVGTPACTGCHSPSGQGNAPAGYPRLGGQHAAYIEKQLKEFRAGNRNNDGEAKTMRSVAERLSDAEITALANYISGLH
jgi:cytochrome c553